MSLTAIRPPGVASAASDRPQRRPGLGVRPNRNGQAARAGSIESLKRLRIVGFSIITECRRKRTKCFAAQIDACWDTSVMSRFSLSATCIVMPASPAATSFKGPDSHPKGQPRFKTVRPFAPKHRASRNSVVPQMGKNPVPGAPSQKRGIFPAHWQ